MLKIKHIFIAFCLSLILISCKNEQNAQVFYTKAVDSYMKKDFDGGLDYVNLCLKEFSDFYQAKLLKAKILYFLNKNSDALKILNSLVKKYPEYTEARIWKIRLLIALEQFEKAEEILDKELSFNSTDWRFYYQYALLSDKRSQIDKKYLMLNKASTYISESYNVYVELADVWVKLGMRDDAIGCLDKAIMLSDNNKQLKELRTYIKQQKDIQ